MKLSRFGIVIWSVAAASVACAGSARAQSIDAGRRIAETWCSSCHLVADNQQNAPNDAIPSFFAIAQMKSTTRQTLAAFLVSPHPPMPNFALGRKQIADVSTYILSLRKAE
jgi:mono/diheme cytochrome c family protein